MARLLLKAQWCKNGRTVAVVDVWDSGVPSLTVRVGRDQISPVDRERLADWLKDYFPRLSHDERYAMLWGAK